mmetsp:Transcript_63714/g.132674  ORF Transcript_63714/g.132674 Transcript_63714/m.132674 type:complete len:301 (+) Transcript_63714:202-1104(+)
MAQQPPSIVIGELFRVNCNIDQSWIPIGQGSSGIVAQAQNIQSGAIVAMKIIPAPNFTPEDCSNVLRQLQELYTSSHPNVVEFYGTYYYNEKNSVIIVTEYMDLGSLRDVMTRIGPAPENVVGWLSGQLLAALVYLHRERRLIHRDIKPSNILLNSRGQVKLSDFGMSTQLANTLDPANTWVGSTTYMSPERISGLQYVWNSDIWSLGITLFELGTGVFPYASDRRLEMVELLDRIVDEPPPALPNDRFSAECCDFMSLAVKKRVEERPHAEILLGHPFVIQNSQADIGPWVQRAMQSLQ